MHGPTLTPAEDRRKGPDRRTLGERRARVALRRLFPHVEFNEREAADRSAAIEAHLRELGSRLGRNVGLSVAALDYLSNISRDVVAPAIVEREVLAVLEHRSVTDPLTGLFNRYHLEATLKQELARCSRSGARLSLLLLDVDQLKAVNDRWGHQAGDRLLRHVAAAIRASLRQADIATRYGGDEFAVILPDTDARAGRLVAERICATVAASPGEGIAPGVSFNSTVSGGLVELPPAAPALSEVQFIVAADRALYAAKGNGGNCVVQEDWPWRG
ncbi:MAG TPA: GGDEF domain-containing protein [Gemmatimonadales bacterium]|jgi:diguanylate cyclase (GGDEF)-like protein|nr:GGDEF domain-containing protein [Gemmatimonadales bacterium]